MSREIDFKIDVEVGKEQEFLDRIKDTTPRIDDDNFLIFERDGEVVETIPYSRWRV